MLGMSASLAASHTLLLLRLFGLSVPVCPLTVMLKLTKMSVDRDVRVLKPALLAARTSQSYVWRRVSLQCFSVI